MSEFMTAGNDATGELFLVPTAPEFAHLSVSIGRFNTPEELRAHSTFALNVLRAAAQLQEQASSSSEIPDEDDWYRDEDEPYGDYPNQNGEV